MSVTCQVYLGRRLVPGLGFEASLPFTLKISEACLRLRELVVKIHCNLAMANEQKLIGKNTPLGLKKQPRGQHLYPYAYRASVSIGFSLCIGLQCFGSSSSKVVTFPYKCRMRSTLCQLPAPAGKSQLFSTMRSTLWQLRLESRSFSVQVSLVWCSIRSTFWQLHCASRNFSEQM